MENFPRASRKVNSFCGGVCHLTSDVPQGRTRSVGLYFIEVSPLRAAVVSPDGVAVVCC